MVNQILRIEFWIFRNNRCFGEVDNVGLLLKQGWAGPWKVTTAGCMMFDLPHSRSHERESHVICGKYSSDNVGKIVVEEDKLLEVWKEHYDRISNEEFSWDREGLTDVRPVCGPGEKISEEEVEAAIGKMKLGKAGGPSGVVADMLKAAGDEGTRWMTELCNAVIKEGKIPTDWSRSWLVNVYKGKGDALECGSYRGIKLVEHAMKVLERVIERRVRNIVKIDSMQFGFMAGKSTTDAIFIVRQLQEKYFRRSIWRGIKSFGWLLWIWRRLLTGFLGRWFGGL